MAEGIPDIADHASSQSDSSSGLTEALGSFLEWADDNLSPAEQQHMQQGLPAPAESAGRLHAGARLGPYVLERTLGQGGMGIVMLAHEGDNPEQQVAVKVLRNMLASDSDVQRFDREVGSLQRLEHPAIVRVIGSGVDGGLPYYAMGLVPGLSLARLLDRLRERATVPEDDNVVRRLVQDAMHEQPSADQSDRRPPAWCGSYMGWVARFCQELAECLQHAHEQGVVHRDVKPGNVLVTPKGRAVLLDFGLARTHDASKLTVTGDFLGTLAYAAPEQLLGTHADARSDVWGLGATLFELLTLARAYDGPDKAALLAAIRTRDPVLLDRRAPRGLSRIARTALHPAPERRYQTAGAMARDLGAQRQGLPVSGRPPGLWVRGRLLLRRHPLLSTTVAAAILLIVVLDVWARVEANQHTAHAVAALERFGAAGVDALAARQAALALIDHLSVDADRQSTVIGLLCPPVQPEAMEQLDAAVAAWNIARATARREATLATNWLGRAFQARSGHGPALLVHSALAADRLLLELRALGDIFAADDVALLDEALAEADAPGRYANLLAREGQVELRCHPPTASVTIEAADGLNLPVHSTELTLDEGSYVVVCAAPGHETQRVPLLVRRQACTLEFPCQHPLVLPSTTPASQVVDVVLEPTGWRPESFVAVPAGWTPLAWPLPRWVAVNGFWIERSEHTNTRMLSTGYFSRTRTPFVDHNLTGPLKLSELTDSVEAIAPEHTPLWGVTRTDLYSYLGFLMCDPGRVPDGFYVDLPTAREWWRAGRGADGRPYPWGHDFDWDWSANRVTAGLGMADPVPPPAGSHARDRSPFGVLDMAGSLAELTRSSDRRLGQAQLVLGGSFRSSHRNQLQLEQRATTSNQPLNHVGFRLALRPWPAWYATVQSNASAGGFVESFDASGPELPAGWFARGAVALQPAANPGRPGSAWAQAGKLICQAEPGHFTDHVVITHAAHAGPAGGRLGVNLRIDATSHRMRWLHISLGSTIWSSRVVCTVALGCEHGQAGMTTLTVGSPTVSRDNYLTTRGQALVTQGQALLEQAAAINTLGDADTDIDNTDATSVYNQPGVVAIPTLRLGITHRIELDLRACDIELRIWPTNEPRPAHPLIARPLPDDWPDNRYLELLTPNLVGMRAVFDDVSWEPVEE